MELIYDTSSFKVTRIEFLHKISLILLIHLRSENAGPHDFFCVTLILKNEPPIFSQMNENGPIILIILWHGLNAIKEPSKSLEYKIKMYGTLMRQDFVLV